MGFIDKVKDEYVFGDENKARRDEQNRKADLVARMNARRRDRRKDDDE